MTGQPSGAHPAPVALLVVHGIGSQDRGQTLDGLLGGLRLAYGSGLAVRRVADDHAVLDGLGRPVHVFEVYWADLLRGEIVSKTFGIQRIRQVVWFPLLNCRSGQLNAQVCPRGRLRLWTAVLAPLGALVDAGYAGARLLASIATGLLQSAREPGADHAVRVRRRTIRETIRATRDDPDVGRTILDDLMDQLAGDVFNYVDGVARALPDGSERNRQLIRNVDEIHVRFRRVAERAVEQGCRDIQVLAHSLGTVVAFLAMCPEAPPDPSADAPGRLTRFYTIGSPLEKIRFFWTRLLRDSRNGPAIVAGERLVSACATDAGAPAMTWDNFFNRLDLVSGRLGAFPGWPVPENHPARGLGGPITAHVAYNRNPDFLALLAEGLTGTPSRFRLSRPRRLARTLLAALESLALPAAFFLLAALGLALMGGFAWVTGWVCSQPFEWIGLGALARAVRIFFVLSMVFTMTVVGTLVGYWTAKEVHARFWAPGTTG